MVESVASCDQNHVRQVFDAPAEVDAQFNRIDTRAPVRAPGPVAITETGRRLVVGIKRVVRGDGLKLRQRRAVFQNTEMLLVGRVGLAAGKGVAGCLM